MEHLHISKHAAEIIRKYAAASEEAGQLHTEIIKLIDHEKWFKLYLPEEFNGLTIHLPAILQLLESIARIDGSTGWTVTLCSGASWFAGFLDHQVLSTVFEKDGTCITGSGAVTGNAVRTSGGYMINGAWKYSSGALHATHFTANCYIKHEDGSPVKDEKQEEAIKSFIFNRAEVKTSPTWSYIGMVATGSHGFEVQNLFVPENRSFQINGELKTKTNAGNYPFLQLAETTLAVNFSGMALHFLELAESQVLNPGNLTRFSTRESACIRQTFAEQKELLLNSRKAFFDVAERSWQDLQDNKLEDPLLNTVSQASRTLAHTARRLTDTLFPYCGLEAAKKDSDLNRIWRDIHTASQHSLLTFEF